MKNTTWILTSQKVCLGQELKPAWIFIENEKILEVSDQAPVGFSGEIVDMKSLVILPGLVDTHVHINEPGRTEWEGFQTATQAAAAGGITTLVDMPLNCIPETLSSAALEEKMKAIQDHCWMDVGFWGGATPDNLGDLPDFLESGILGVKTFMIDSGIPSFRPMSLLQIDQAMPALAKAHLPYLFHAELDSGESKKLPEGPDYQAFLFSRPKIWENKAIEGLIELARKHHCQTHIVHLSSAQALDSLRKAKAAGVPISAETCPHYLLLNEHSVSEFSPEGEQTLFKCCPPIREEANRLALWQGLLDGTLEMVVSDHSPCTPQLKHFASPGSQVDFSKAWGGVSSLQYTLSLLWTEGQKFSAPLPQISQWLSTNPAKLANLGSFKGKIAAGFDADLIVFDPEAQWTITPAGTYHRHKGSPYQGRKVQGQVLKTYLRGKKIFDLSSENQTNSFSPRPLGKFLLRGPHL